ncbi:NUDIX domain-containing protein [Actinomadura sp. B10D3]|uniref:NUDIX hydrolase n=1 Tax=Actinomadura sp. B10D3 TaxID=3153557 RepID=UPI00325F751E
MADYISWLRSRVGNDPVQLNFAAGCVCVDDSVLLQRRGDHDAWGFPGGAIELGESAEEAVLREVGEETGLRVKIETMLGVYTKYMHTYPNGDVAQTLAVFFRCTPVGGGLRVDGEETLDLRYFPLEQAPRLFNQQHRDALDDLAGGRRGVFR